MEYSIETHNLKKSFRIYHKSEGVLQSIKGIWQRKSFDKVALEATNLKIEAGQIVGIVGSNGAGKTTLLKLFSGLITPTSGEAKILGFNPRERKNDFLRQISILLGQKNQLWWDITPLDSFSLLCKIYDQDKKKHTQRIDELSTLLGCTSVLNTQLRKLSLGERMKMEIIGALLHDPKVIFLDEPTIGLDLVAQESMRKFLIEYTKEKKPTILLTSHYMEDITALANKLLLMSKGNIVYEGTVELLTSQGLFKGNEGKNENFEEIIKNFLEKESRLF